ncbi:MAG TPA: hypothetical protein VF851_00335 [Steroidobacteraceae bacterium]
MTKSRIGIALLTFLPVFAGVVETSACVGHWLAIDWEPHAIFHTLMGLSGLLAAWVLILVLTWIPLRRGERWAWFAIAAAVLVIYGGMLLSDHVTGGGLRNYAVVLGSGSTVYAGITVAMVLYAVGLALTWPGARKT